MTPVDVVMAFLPAVGFTGSFVAFTRVWASVTTPMSVDATKTNSRKTKK